MTMPTPQEIQQAIYSVHDQQSFVQNLLIETLNWQIPDEIEDIGDISFEWNEKDLGAEGLEREYLDGSIYQIQKMADDQPWGIFLLEFKNEDVFLRNRGLTGPLRKVLRGVVTKRRTTKSTLPSWHRDNLLFICTYQYKHYRFAYFKAPNEKEKTAPLALFGWNESDTDIRTLCTHNLPFLQWNHEKPDYEKWREAFNVEKVTKNFYNKYAEIFGYVEGLIGQSNDLKGDTLRLYTQTLFNRLMFLRFIEKKDNWLDFNGQKDYLKALYEAKLVNGKSFYQSRLCPLFFEALAIEGKQESKAVGKVPFLNGGLFEKGELDKQIADIPNEAFEPILAQDGLFYRYNFTVEESTPLDIEVAVDPEMLGKVFEKLVTGRHESGSYYTPKSIVSFMCREAIKGYLCSKTSASWKAIELLVDEHELEIEQLSEQDRDDILYYLETLKAVDPACGSGAYLLGLLQELMAIRRTLQNQKLRTDPEYHYKLKLKAISRSLYGVDIDPFATNVAKLRLWLSLAVEADYPQALPNLDFKIETGDAVLGPCNELTDADDMLFISELKERAEALVVKKDEYMTAHGDRKKELFEEIRAEEKAIASETSTAYGESIIAWYVHFAEVFMATRRQQEIQTGVEELQDYQITTLEPTGFDIVLANPPYIRQELIKDIKPTLEKVYPVTYSGTADLYTYFYTRAVELLGLGGMLAFISSNKWFRANYGKKLRSYLADKCTIHSITDFQDSPVFEGTTAYPMIFIAQKGKTSVSTIHTETQVPDGNVNVKAVIHDKGKVLSKSAIKGEDWSFIDKASADRIKKMDTNGIPLETYVGEKMYIGIKTGFNKAFIIDSRIRNQLILDDPASEDLIHPLLMGRDIKKWKISGKDQWIIFTRRGVNIDSYPVIKKYLSQYREKLEPKPLDWEEKNPEEKWPGRKPGPYQWYEIQDNVVYYKKFEKNKIVFPDISPEPRFCLDTDGFYPDMTAFMIPSSDLYLLGVLNSKPVLDYYMEISAQIRGGYLRYKRQYVIQIPIPKATPNEKKSIEKYVQKCLDARGQNCEKWESQVDQIVTRLYGLEE